MSCRTTLHRRPTSISRCNSARIIRAARWNGGAKSAGIAYAGSCSGLRRKTARRSRRTARSGCLMPRVPKNLRIKKEQVLAGNREVVVVDAIRTPIGRYAGAIATVRPDDLAALVMKALVDRTGVKPEAIDDVFFGAANQSGEDNRNVARMAALLAGLPVEVPGATVNRLCGSSLQAINSAAQAIAWGDGDVMIAGGVESMTRAPFVQLKPEKAFDRAPEIFDTTIGWRMINPRMQELYPPISLGETAERVAEQYAITREEQDRFALESQRRAKAAMDRGAFGDEIVPVPVRRGKEQT